MKPTTKLISILLSALLCITSTYTFADLENQLQTELDLFKQEIQTKVDQELILVANKITGSGVTDDALYLLVEAKLKSEHQRHLENRREKQISRNVNALVRTYGSFGKKESRNFIVHLVEASKSRFVRERAHRLHPQLYWYRERNQIMQNTAYFEEGQHLMTHRYLSLLNNSNATMMRWAAEEISRRGSAEDVVFATMARIVNEQGKSYRSNQHLDALAWFCKILARLDANNHGEFLQNIQADPEYHKKLRKYARF